MTSDISTILDRSIVIVAHPDDEILWLSSVLDKANKVVFCFQDCATVPLLGPGRARLLAEYPLKNVLNLGIEEALSFNTADWERPRRTDYGIHILRNSRVRARYESNFRKLVNQLAPLLSGYRNVFTHNPWGEYGHEDHVQVYRALKTLQPMSDFAIWFSNYCSQKSATLMLEHISGFSSDYITLPTNVELARMLRDLYRKHGCWTWYNDYQWFREESIMSDAALDTGETSHGHIFPINMLKTDFPDQPGSGRWIQRSLRKMLTRH